MINTASNQQFLILRQRTIVARQITDRLQHLAVLCPPQFQAIVAGSNEIRTVVSPHTAVNTLDMLFEFRDGVLSKSGCFVLN